LRVDEEPSVKVECYPATINNSEDGAVIIINRTHYDNSVLELIAPVNLREKFNLKEGSSVQVKVFTSQTLIGKKLSLEKS